MRMMQLSEQWRERERSKMAGTSLQRLNKSLILNRLAQWHIIRFYLAGRACITPARWAWACVYSRRVSALCKIDRAAMTRVTVAGEGLWAVLQNPRSLSYVREWAGNENIELWKRMFQKENREESALVCILESHAWAADERGKFLNRKLWAAVTRRF